MKIATISTIHQKPSLYCHSIAFNDSVHNLSNDETKEKVHV